MTVSTDLDDLPPPKDWNELVKVEHDLKAPIEADYAAAVGPMRRKKAQAVADVEREYAARMRDAKAELRAAQRVYADTAAALSKWRKATVEAAEQEYAGTRRPWGVDRKKQLQPIEAWARKQAERLQAEYNARAQQGTP